MFKKGLFVTIIATTFLSAICQAQLPKPEKCPSAVALGKAKLNVFRLGNKWAAHDHNDYFDTDVTWFLFLDGIKADTQEQAEARAREIVEQKLMFSYGPVYQDERGWACFYEGTDGSKGTAINGWPYPACN